jgi:acyl-CoA synthetase
LSGADGVGADGWLYTGDIGVVDTEGWVTIQSRVKDIINRGGEKFSAAEIEAAISSHRAIESVAVVGTPDRRLGEQVAAFITIRDNVGWPGETALLAHLEQQRLAKQKFPVSWHVRSELPRTASGKILKRALLDDWTKSLASDR